jgi:hypothetical protein
MTDGVASPPDDLPTRLLATTSEMLELDETISTRNIMKRMPDDFTYPAAVSRPKKLRKIYEAARDKQKSIRLAAQKLGHSSRSDLEVRIARRDSRIEELEKQVQILIASHRALYAAVGEMGGAAAWLRFFEKHHRAMELLDDLKARTPPRPPLRLVAATEVTDSPLGDDALPY